MKELLTQIPLWAIAAFSLAGASWLFLMVMMLRQHLHWLQLEDYSPTRMFGFAVKRWDRIIFHVGFYALLPASESLYASHGGWEREMFASVVWIIGASFECWRLARDEKTAKKKLVFTPRAKRIFVLGLLFSFVGLKALGLLFPAEHFGLTMIGSMYLSTVLAGVWLSLSVGILWPQEKLAQRRYIADAKRILAEVKPLIIGITGSYGKTGTKELLAAMLAEKYNVFRPPGSYNTLMGVTRAVREGLRPYHEAFVVEMGAYREGSIQKLCNLTHPTHGIITIIGVQHLERFGSQKAIQRAKGELIRALPSGGVVVLNGDDPLCREIGEARSGEVIYFSYSEKSSDTMKRASQLVSATKINITPTGSDFELIFPDKEVYPVKLSLLGRAAISNAVAAVAMADRLGVPRAGIVRVLATMPHVRHRLEPRTGEGGITVIDDAFNSNPIGAAGALEVLGLATGGRRVLVTPGMIELGELEAEANRTFGQQAAKACDLAVLVGVKRVEPIREGLLKEGFPAEHIWVVPTLTEGLERLKTYLKPGDTMLLENDLPDQYAGM